MPEHFPKDWPALIELFKKIRALCDEVALAFGFVPPADDSRASVRFALGKLLSTQESVRPTEKNPRGGGARALTKQFVDHWNVTYPREKEFHRATPAKLARWIAKLRHNLKEGKTDCGKTISPAERRAIESYIGQLDEARRNRKNIKKIGKIRSDLAAAFVKMGIYGAPRGEYQDADNFIQEKLKRARRRLRRHR
jgi:hypothetical protein